MDPICCLLGICCPPATRLQKMTAYFEGMGASPACAAAIAVDMIEKVDASSVGKMVKFIVEKARQ